MRAVVIGPGRVGCGYLAPLLLRAGWEVTLVVRSAEGTRSIERNRRFRVRVTRGAGAHPPGDGLEPGTVTEFGGVKAVELGSDRFNQAVADADLVCTAIRPGGFSQLARPLALALAARGRGRALEVWVVENDYRASALGQAVQRVADEAGMRLPAIAFAGAVAHAVVGRGSWYEPGPPEFVSDAWRTMVVERCAGENQALDLPGIQFTTGSYTARLREKLYVFNSGHAIAAYLGWLRGHATIDQAVADPFLHPIVAGSMLEARRALLCAHPELGDDLYGPVEEALRRFRDHELADPVTRVARDPLRKLAPDDRLLGPVDLIRRTTGRIPAYFALGVAGALLYRASGDRQACTLADHLSAHGVMEVLADVCHLGPDDPFAEAIAARYRGFVFSEGETLFPPAAPEFTDSISGTAVSHS